MSRLDATRSATWPGSLTLSSKAAASRGSSGTSEISFLAGSLMLATRASASRAVVSWSASSVTRACKKGSSDSRDSMRMRVTPWRITE